MMIKQVSWKERKKGSNNRAKKIGRYSHFTKRSTTIATSQKYSPLSLKDVWIFTNFNYE